MIPRPSNVGTGADIPDDLARVAHLQRSNVVAWVTLDEKYKDAVGDLLCAQNFAICIFPCFWPLLPICVPCIIASKISDELTIQNTYWVLTTTDIKIIVNSHDGPCGGSKGLQVKSIPLDSITDCGISTPDSGCCACDAAVPTIYIDTASSGARNSDDNGPRHEAMAYGLSGYDWLVAEIIVRRDALRGHHHHAAAAPMVTVPAALAEMDRGDQTEPSSTIESRLQKIDDLRNRNMLTQLEYENKRQEIIGSI